MSLLNIRLKKLRELKGLTQVEVAEHFGIATRTLQHYEKGSRNPDYDRVILLAKYFNVSTDYLLGATDTPLSYEGELTEERRITEEIFLLSDENRKQLVDYLEFIKTKE